MMELRVRVTISEHGADPDSGERLLEGFLATHPESAPVVSQNLAEKTLTVSFSVLAEDAFAAGPVGGKIFMDGVNASELPATEILDVSVSHAEIESETRELQPA
jgi:hypothetical protein